MASDPSIITHRNKGFFERFSVAVSRATGTTAAFICAGALVVLWGVTGPLFDFSQTWQLCINTGTTIVTFLMVFVIQRAQNKDSLAINLKLNELVASHELSSNRLINAEELTEDELQLLHRYYRHLAQMAQQAANLQESHSIEEAEAWHKTKRSHHASRHRNENKNENKNNDLRQRGHTISPSE